jgi:hypothetical protein
MDAGKENSHKNGKNSHLNKDKSHLVVDALSKYGRKGLVKLEFGYVHHVVIRRLEIRVKSLKLLTCSVYWQFVFQRRYC